LRALWEHVAATVGQQQQQQQVTSDPTGGVTGDNSAAPPTLSDPVSGPAQIISSLWRSYGPSIIASGNALLRQSATTVTPTVHQATLNSPAASPPIPPSYVRADTSQSVSERRRQLEAELAALQKDGDLDLVPVPIPAASPLFSSSRTSSESDLHLRERTTGSGGKFEEIDVPSDAEGYDVGSSGNGSKDDLGSVRETGIQRRGSWFGWGGSPSGSKGGYERVKSD
jgi:receptor expression-enhancing protein 1/2/3/4